MKRKQDHATCVLLVCALFITLLQAGCSAVGEKAESPLQATNLLGTRQDGAKLTDKQVVQACISTADQLSAQGHLAEAIKLYQRAIQLDATKANSLAHRLAVLYDRGGDPTTAIKYYERAIELEPRNADIISDYGYCNLTCGDFSRAESLFRQAISMDEANSRARTNLALALAWQSKYDESYKEFAAVVGPAAAHSNLGVIMAKQGKDSLARQAFNNALQGDASLGQPRAFLAYYDELNQQSGVRQAQAVVFQ